MSRFGRSYPLHPSIIGAPSQVTVTRGLADSAPASDTLVRALTLVSRPLADSAAASDTLATRIGRTAADNAAASDTLARGVQSFTRSVADAAHATDVAARTAFGLDTAHASDALARGAQSFTRTLTDNAGASDALGRVLSLVVRTAADNAAAADALTRTTAGPPRPLADSAPATDTATHGPLNLVRPVTDNAPASDTLGGLFVFSAGATNVANPFWPIVGVDADFTAVGPPSLPGASTRVSLDAPYRRLAARTISIGRGRQYELDQVQTGTCQIDIPDPDELLNADNMASPFNQPMLSGAAQQITAYRPAQVWAMWPNQPGSGNLYNPAVDASADPSFDFGTGGWAATGATTIAVSTAQAFDGTQSLRVTQVSPGSSQSIVLLKQFTAPGVTYTISAYVNVTGGAAVHLFVRDGAGNIYNPPSASTTAQNQWVRIYLSWTAADTNEPVYLYADGVAAPAFNVDAVQLEFGATVSPFTAAGPTRYPIYTGFIERFSSKYGVGGLRATRRVEMVDALSVLSRVTIDQGYATEIKKDTPSLVVPYDEPGFPNLVNGPSGVLGQGASSTGAQGGQVSPAGDTFLDGSGALVLNQALQSDLTKNPAASQYAGVDLNHVDNYSIYTGGATFEFWARWSAGSVELGLFGTNVSGTYYVWDTFLSDHSNDSVWGGFSTNRGLMLGSSDRIPHDGSHTICGGKPAATSGSFTFDGSTVPDGKWHYYAITLFPLPAPNAGNYGMRFQLDSAQYAFDHPVGPLTSLRYLGGNQLVSIATCAYGDLQSTVSIAKAAFYNYDIGTTRTLAHYNRGAGFIGEPAGARVNRLMQRHWAAAWSTPYRGFATLAPDFGYQGRGLLDCLQEIQETERGLLYVDSGGTVQFEDRSARYLAARSATPQAVCGENPNPVVAINLNPFFASSNANWTPAGATFAVTSSYQLLGVGSGQLTPTGGMPASVQNTPVAVTAGTSYTADARIFSRKGFPGGVALGIDWINNVGGVISTTLSATTGLVAAQWTSVSVVGTAPAGTVTARPTVAYVGTPAATDVIWLSQVRLYLTGQVDELPYYDFGTDRDPTYTFTQATLTRPNNSQYPPVVNPTGMKKYGQRVLTQQLQVNSDLQLQQAGTFYLNRYADPRTRLSRLTFNPASNPALWPVLLGLDVSSQVTVIRRAPAGNIVLSQNFYVEKITHQIDAQSGRWTVELQMSPVYVPSPWLCGSSTLGATTTPIY